MTDTTDPTCPDMSAIESHVDGSAPSQVIALHIETCAACRDAATEVRANNALLSRFSELGVQRAEATADQPVVPGHEIEAELGRGGQGVVYRAIQQRTRRTVALKLLTSPGWAVTSRQRQRFEREVELIASIEHAGVVTVYECGETSDGRLFLAMQYVEGTPLNQWASDVRAAPGGVERIQRVAIALCRAMQAAHQRGVIHRDLKPANALVDATDQPHVLDFGLARLEAEPSQEVTRVGEFLGTLAYAAPEQTLGDPLAVDVRSDVYALGVMIYEALTGLPPYTMPDDPAEAIRIVRETVPRTPRTVNRALRWPGDLDTVLLKALAKEPDRRYQSAGALGDELERVVQRRPIEARRDSPLYLMSRLIQRHRLAAAGAFTILALLVVFGVSMAVLYEEARTESEKVRQINVFLEDTLGSVESARGGDDVALRELLDEAVLWIDIALSGDPEVAASIRTIVGNAYRNLGLLDHADPLLVRALADRRDALGEHHAEVAQSMSALALLRRDQGRLDEARELLEAALALRLDLLGRDNASVAYTLSSLAQVMQRLGQFDEAARLLDESRTVRLAVFGEQHSDVAMIDYRIAELTIARGHVDAGIERHQDVLDQRWRVLHPQHPDLQRSLMRLAELHLLREEPDAAATVLEQCLAIRRQGLRADDWRIGETALALAHVRVRQQRDDAAVALAREALDIFQTSLGQDDPRTREATALVEQLQ